MIVIIMIETFLLFSMHTQSIVNIINIQCTTYSCNWEESQTHSKVLCSYSVSKVQYVQNVASTCKQACVCISQRVYHKKSICIRCNSSCIAIYYLNFLFMYSHLSVLIIIHF